MAFIFLSSATSKNDVAVHELSVVFIMVINNQMYNSFRGAIYMISCVAEFIDSSIMFIHLDNDRIFIVPLDKFLAIKSLSGEEKKNFEIIDDKYLSFLSIDEVYSVEELIGFQ